MSRNPQYMQGRREAIKWAITFMHARAEGMNDPRAKAALNVVATDMGDYTRDGHLPHIKRLVHAPSHLDQVPKVYEKPLKRIGFWSRWFEVLGAR